jgi:hypothetical protein
VTRVVLYARRGCHLCDDARAVIEIARAATPFVFEEVDIETSEDLVRDFGVRIPVVTVDGDEIAEYTIDPARLREALGA